MLIAGCVRCLSRIHKSASKCAGYVICISHKNKQKAHSRALDVCDVYRTPKHVSCDMCAMFIAGCVRCLSLDVCDVYRAYTKAQLSALDT